MRLFRPFDARIKAELRTQKKTIWKGLLCVLVTSLLTATTIPLTKEAIRAITDAAPSQAAVLGEKEIADAFKVDIKEVRKRMAAVTDEVVPGERRIADAFGTTVDEVRAKLSKVGVTGARTAQNDALIRL